MGKRIGRERRLGRQRIGNVMLPLRRGRQWDEVECSQHRGMPHTDITRRTTPAAKAHACHTCHATLQASFSARSGVGKVPRMCAASRNALASASA